MVNCRDVQHRQNCGALCVGDGWFSKINSGNVNAQQICIDQGYDGTIVEYGTNNEQLCKYPGNTYGSPDLSGGTLQALGFSVSWRCSSGNINLMLSFKCIRNWLYIILHILDK